MAKNRLPAGLFGQPIPPEMYDSDFLGKGHRINRNEKLYLLGLIKNDMFQASCPSTQSGQVYQFQDPETAGKVLQSALKRTNYGEALDLLRGSGYRSTECAISTLAGSGDVWAAIWYPRDINPTDLFRWSGRGNAQRTAAQEKRRDPVEVYYGGYSAIGKGTTDEKLARFTQKEASQFSLSLFYMADVIDGVG